MPSRQQPFSSLWMMKHMYMTLKSQGHWISMPSPCCTESAMTGMNGFECLCFMLHRKLVTGERSPVVSTAYYIKQEGKNI